MSTIDLVKQKHSYYTMLIRLRLCRLNLNDKGVGEMGLGLRALMLLLRIQP